MQGRYPIEWVRVTEQWYEDFTGWKKSVIDSPPKYTKPPWAKYDKYPFLEPYVDFTSTFILERPTMITCGIPGLTRGSIDIDDIIIKCLSVMLDINSF